MPLRARDEHETDGHGKEEQGDEAHDPPADRWRRDRAGGHDGHGEPPFGEHPGGPLPRAGGLPDDVISVVGHSSGRELPEEVGEIPIEPVGGSCRESFQGSGVGVVAGRSITDERIEATA